MRITPHPLLLCLYCSGIVAGPEYTSMAMTSDGDTSEAISELPPPAARIRPDGWL